MAILAYAGFFRYDEVSRIRRSDILFEKFFMKIFIEKSKCDQYRAGAWVHIARTNRRHTCPYKVLNEYLETADIDSGGDEFIFRGYVKTKAGHKLKGNMHLGYTTAREHILKAVEAIGLNTKLYGSHSFRRGGATYSGGWASRIDFLKTTDGGSRRMQRTGILPTALRRSCLSRRGAVVKGVEHISTIVLINI